MRLAAEDFELLRQYVERGSESAVRQAGRGGMANEVTQAVFILLMRKADRLPPGTVLGDWLFKATRYTSMNALRAQARRRRHEQEAAAMANTRNTPDVGWARIAPILDEAIARLSPTDRAAIVLRYLERRSLADVGATLGVSENATHMRVQRATDKMRAFFQRRGMAMTATALGVAIMTRATHAAPPVVSQTLTVAALRTAQATPGHAAPALAKSVAREMVMERIKSTIALTVAVSIVVGGAALTLPKSTPAPPLPLHADTTHT